jgi:mono/diheme cytochrome c family protein
MQRTSARWRRRYPTTGLAAVLVGVAGAASAAAPADAGAAQGALQGAALYSEYCANCHGAFGEGDGVLAPSLSVVLQDLRYLTVRNNGEFPRDFILEIVDGRASRAAHGPEGMPVWGAELARDEPFDEHTEERVNAKIDALADFLESIQITRQGAARDR